MDKGRIKFAEWQRYAEEDLEVAELVLHEKGPANQICFHTQQAGEKYLKGFLVFCGEKFKKTHQLRYLLEQCNKIDASFAKLLEDVVCLTQFYTETRYPGDMPEFSLKDAKEGLESALKIKQFVLKKVGLN